MSNRTDLLTRHGARLEGDAPVSFGDPAAEHAAVRARAGVFDLSGRDRLAARGADTPTFLNRLLTLGIDRVPVGGGGRAFLLTSTGKVKAAFHLLRVAEDDFWLDTAPGLGEDLAQGLDFYLFGEQVELQPMRDAWSLLSVQGPLAAEVLRRLGLTPPAALWSHGPANALGAELRVAQLDRTGSGGFDLWVPPAAFAAVFDALVEAGAHPAGALALESLRVEAGLPAWGHEYDEQTIPLEVSGMEGITDGKGCYPGQEVIERILSLGRPPRALVCLRLVGEARRGDEVTLAGKPVGALTSVAPLPDGTFVGLALVRRRAAEGDDVLAVGGVEAVRRTPVHGAHGG